MASCMLASTPNLCPTHEWVGIQAMKVTCERRTGQGGRLAGGWWAALHG